MNKEYKEKILKTGLEGFLIGVIQGCLRAHKQQSIVGSILESMLILIGFEFVDAFFTKNIDWIDISAACLGGFFTYIIYYYLKNIVRLSEISNNSALLWGC